MQRKRHVFLLDVNATPEKKIPLLPCGTTFKVIYHQCNHLQMLY